MTVKELKEKLETVPGHFEVCGYNSEELGEFGIHTVEVHAHDEGVCLVSLFDSPHEDDEGGVDDEYHEEG